MGTTTTVLVLLPYGALAAHVGDSRALSPPRNAVEQLTFDHSLVWEMRGRTARVRAQKRHYPLARSEPHGESGP